MNVLYIFNIKEEFYKIYKNRMGELFYILNRIYNMKVIDKKYGYNLFCQICNFLDKENINIYIKEEYKDKVNYSNNDFEHIINDIFLGEISILSIKNSNIKIESNIDKPSFINNLKKLDLNLFVCNFNTMEYYFIKNKNKITN